MTNEYFQRMKAALYTGLCGTCGTRAEGPAGGVVLCNCPDPKWRPQTIDEMAQTAVEVSREFLLEPNMFWDANDPERPFDNLNDLLVEGDYEGENVVEVQRAVYCKNAAYRFKITRSELSDEDEIYTEKLGDEQYAEYIACRRIGFALNTMMSNMARSRAEELHNEYVAGGGEDLSRGKGFRHLPLRRQDYLRRLAKEQLVASFEEGSQP